ncbi:MAG: hypothetical protein NTY01_10060 [Verrucomicrobia bacterium]|nr:hypothetical protein [Verrucomicrobiota bacterium]
MKYLLFLLPILFSAIVSVSAAEVDVTLKNGKKVTGAVLVDNSEKLDLLVTASNGVYRQSINKADILEVKDHAAAAENMAFGPKDKEKLDRLIKSAEAEATHREKLASKAQESFDGFVRTRNRTKETAMQRTGADKRENELRVRAGTARSQSEISRSKLSTLHKEREMMNKKMTEAQQQAK